MKKDYVKTARSRERKAKMKNRNNFQKNQKPMLRFSPTAWAKLLFCRDMTNNEVGGFGITEADDLLFVTDFALIKQKVTSVSVVFADESVADFFEDQVAAGIKPEQFARIWLHTHPGNSPEPSMTDEQTFTRVFGKCDWSVMCIVAQDGGTFARLRFNVGPGGEVKIPVYVDYSFEFDAANFELWEQQYKANVEEEIFNPVEQPKQTPIQPKPGTDLFGGKDPDNVPQLSGEDLLAELDSMEPFEREIFMDELAVRSDFWNEESEAFYG